MHELLLVVMVVCYQERERERDYFVYDVMEYDSLIEIHLEVLYFLLRLLRSGRSSQQVFGSSGEKEFLFGTILN